MTAIYVAFGGALGAMLRYFVAVAVAFPFGTLCVNVLGSFLIGIAFVVLRNKGLDTWQVFFTTGVLGGFTTFSAFSLDTLRLVEAGRLAAAGGYILASVGLSLAAVFVAVSVAKGWAA